MLGLRAAQANPDSVDRPALARPGCTSVYAAAASIGKNKRPGETGFSLMLLTEPGAFATYLPVARQWYVAMTVQGIDVHC